MSTTREVTIWCDECLTWEQFSSPLRLEWKGLRKRGWLRKEGKDYCPSCAKKIREMASCQMAPFQDR